MDIASLLYILKDSIQVLPHPDPVICCLGAKIEVHAEILIDSMSAS